MPYKDESGFTGYYGFTNDGSKKTQKEFDAAFDVFIDTGKPPKGFVFHDQTDRVQFIQSALRRGFETINQPIQNLAKAEDTSLNQFAGSVGNLLRKAMGKEPVDPSQAEGRTFQRLAETVNTPEKAVGTAALAGAASATGGISGFLPALLRAGAFGAGTFAGQEATGSQVGQDIGQKLKEPLFAAMLSAGTEGAVGIATKALGMSLSKKGMEQIAGDTVDILKKKYGHAAGQGPQSINAIASTPTGLEDLTAIGVKALRQDVSDIAGDLIVSVNQSAPRSLSKAAKETIAGLVDDMVKASDDMLKNVGKEEAFAAAKQEMNKNIINIRQAVLADLQVKSGTKVDMATVTKLVNFANQAKDKIGGAEVIHALRAHNQGKGFDIVKFQEYVRRQFDKSGVFDDVALAAGRGVRGGVDQPIRASIPLTKNIPFIGRIGLQVPGNTKLAGTVRSKAPDIAPGTTVLLNNAIKDFYGNDRK